MTDAVLNVAVITPEGAAYEGTASMVVVPAFDGEVAFLVGHAPFVGALGAGEMRVTTAEGEKQFYLEGGVVQVLDNEVAVLAEAVRSIEQLDPEAELEALKAALAVPATSAAGQVERQRKAEAARARLRLAQRGK